MNQPLLAPDAGAPFQRNRRLLLTLPACALPVLTACGGGADLSYDTEQALYVVGEAIPPNNPQLTTSKPQAGHTAPTFFVTPALPPGLKLNAQTGVIAGTPTQLRRQATYTVIARNNRGSAETQVRITVTGRGRWVTAATVPGARNRASMAPLPGGKFLIVGGTTDTGPTSSAAIYDPLTDAWSPAPSMQLPRTGPAAVALRDGRVIVFGGDITVPGAGLTEIYDASANAWTTTGKMNESRNLATGHLLGSGKVLAVGGIGRGGIGVTYRDTLELYDPGTGGWTVLSARLSVPRFGHAAVLLRNGETLFVVGGNSAATAELYQVDGTATRVVAYGVDALEHRAVLLDDGSVLVTSDGSNLSRRFNPRNDSWSTSSMVNGPRVAPSATLLADGRVLVAGGQDVDSSFNSAEIYNPDLNRWTAAAPMSGGRQAAVAALLGDGSVLVVGGIGSNGAVDASERYLP